MNIIVKQLSYDDDYYQYCQLLQQLTNIDPNLITSGDFYKCLELINNNPLHKIFIAKDGDIIIATVTIFIEPKFIHNISMVGHIEDVVVCDKYRGHGLGKKLMNHAIDFAKQHNCYKIILDCSEKNVEFYQKLGFTKKENQMALYFK